MESKFDQELAERLKWLDDNVPEFEDGSIPSSHINKYMEENQDLTEDYVIVMINRLIVAEVLGHGY